MTFMDLATTRQSDRAFTAQEVSRAAGSIGMQLPAMEIHRNRRCRTGETGRRCSFQQSAGHQ